MYTRVHICVFIQTVRTSRIVPSFCVLRITEVSDPVISRKWSLNETEAKASVVM